MKKNINTFLVLIAIFLLSSSQCLAYLPSKWQGLYSGTLTGDNHVIWMMIVDRDGLVKKLSFFSTKFMKSYGKENAGVIPDSGIYKVFVAASAIEMEFLSNDIIVGEWANLYGRGGAVKGLRQKDTAKYAGDYNFFIFGGNRNHNVYITESVWKIDESGNITEPTIAPAFKDFAVSGAVNDFGIFIATSKTPSASGEYFFSSLGAIENNMISATCLIANQLQSTIMVGFKKIPAPEYTPLSQEQISQLYVSIFGRASEGEGNIYWRSAAQNMSDVANIMLSTEPAKAYFGDKLYDNLEFIKFIYKNTLGKTYEEDPAGVDYWVSQLDQGVSKGEVAASLINAAMDPQYKELPSQKRFINRVDVCNYASNVITIVPEAGYLYPFVDFIKDIDYSESSVATAKEKVLNYIAQLPYKK